MKKAFRISAAEIRPLATGFGGCIATDRIMVDGARVGYMYREAPDNSLDSGWRFTAGDEDERYMSEASRHGVYDVNTVANYDPEIVAYLNAPEGSRFARAGDGGFQIVED